MSGTASRAERKSDRRTYLLALRLIVGASLRADPLRFVVTALGQAGMSIAGLIVSVFVKDLTNDLTQGHRERLTGHLIALLIATAALFTAGSVGGTGLIRLAEVGGQRAGRDLSQLMLGLPTLDSFERPDVLDRVQILLQNRYVLFVTVQSMGVLLRIVAIILPAGFLLASVDPLLILLPVAALPSLLLGPLASSRSNRWMDRNAARMRRRNATFDLATTPAAACEVRTFGMGPALHAEHSRLERELLIGGRRVSDQAALLIGAGQLLPFLGYALALVVVLRQLRHGQATVGDITLVVTIAATIQEGMSFLGDFLRSSASMAAATRRLAWLFDYARSEQDPGATLSPPVALRTGLSLRGVGFDYAGGGTALDGVTLDIPPGTTVALVGQNGAGKSTLVKLLLGLYRPTRGQILVDGTDLATIDPALWRSSCSGSFQDHLRLKLPAGTVIGVGDLPSLNDTSAIESAAARGGASDVVAGLPSGLGTQLGKEFDGGTDLSGGQWQKLALARGMMRTEPLLLVLDEPTSALDPMTEAALFDSYAAHARQTGARTGAITVLVSHRFSTVRNADLVLVVEGGRLVEVGNHAELMALGGDYAQLYESQAASYR